MLTFFKALVLLGLVRILIVTEKPLLCSGIYGGFAFLLLLASESSIPAAALLEVGLVFGYATVYFYLLCQFESHEPYWWIVLVAASSSAWSRKEASWACGSVHVLRIDLVRREILSEHALGTGGDGVR